MTLKDKILESDNSQKMCLNCKCFELIGKRNTPYCNKTDKLLLNEFLDSNRSECCELLKEKE